MSRESPGTIDAERRPDSYAVAEDAPPEKTRSLFLAPTGDRTEVDRPPPRQVAALDDPRRFSLRSLLFMLTLASFVLAAGIRIPRPAFAGLVGTLSLITAVAAGRLKKSGATLELAWWTLFAIYLLAGAFAVRWR